LIATLIGIDFLQSDEMKLTKTDNPQVSEKPPNCIKI